MIHKVSKKECIEAIKYFHASGYIEQIGCHDAEHYCKILLKKVANVYNIELLGIDDEVNNE